MNNVANINDVSNSVKATPSILHCGTPVITTGIMAKLYGTDEANVKMNFSRNADRFIEGKHYFKLEGVELKGFKDRVTESYPVKFHDQIVGKRARSLTLWTERGAARHAKMLDTDQAWDVFEALEDFYFTKKDNSQRKAKQIAGRITSEQQEAIKQLVLNRGKALPKEKQAKAMITMWSSLKSHFGCTYKEIDSDKFTEALSLAARVPLEGEYLPKQTERFVGCRVLHHYDDKGAIVKSEIAADDEQLTSPKVFADLAESRGYVMVKKDAVGAKFNKHKIAHTLEGAIIHIRAMKEYWNNGLKDSLKQLGYQHTGSMTEHMTDILFHLDWAIHEIKGDNLDKLPA
ncbi:ORF6N domain-containing protein [Providencia rettgeri]|nr:ORF6N domain-containing protein [Providencia rettgeri]EJD6508465.1 ORF6N domain-containing protein [Providencia rettgeri]MDH2379157.1 ORF6N domain-containing protein [Providencia rettgeri]